MNSTVKLIWITPEAEKQILYIARVSSEHQDSPSTKLIGYLIDHQHWSPFEMTSMCVEIETTRAIGRQILRHRSFHFQEFSQRYASIPESWRDEGDFDVPEARFKGEKNRQSSITPMDQDTQRWWRQNFLNVAQYSEGIYAEALHRGMAPEVARFIRLEATPTRMYMAGTIRSWIHYLQLRLAVDTQLEHREVAHQIYDIFVNELPIIAEALGWETPTAA